MISISSSFYGAHDRNRTGDLILTKDVLCRLSYMGLSSVGSKHCAICSFTCLLLTSYCFLSNLERETGFEPATLSLEG